MNYKYIPKGVCSREMNFEIEDGVIKTLNVVGGCNGNLKGISSLLSGMKVDDAIKKLKGIECGYKNTSCPDQISIALKEYKQKRDFK